MIPKTSSGSIYLPEDVEMENDFMISVVKVDAQAKKVILKNMQATIE